MTAAHRFVAAFAMLATSWLPAGASGQPAAPLVASDRADGAQTSIPDIPSGPATIRGRVVHGETPDAASGVPVVLYALSPSGVPGLRGMVAGADGSFSFEGVTNDPATVYLVGARYRDVPFDVRLSLQAGELDREVELPISDPTTDASGARVADALIQFDTGCSGLTIRESHRLESSADRVIYIPESERDGREPLLRVELPDDARELQVAVGDNLEWVDGALSFWGPLFPGPRDLAFSYGIPERGSAFEVRRIFPSGSERVRLVRHSTGPTLTPAASSEASLRVAESVELGGERFDTLESGAIAPGAGVTVHVELAAGSEPPAGLSMRETRIWLDLDGAAMAVDQQHVLEIESSGALAAASGAPLLCIPLPDGAEALRFSPNTLALGPTRDASGAIALQGPFPPGELEVTLRYRVRTNGEAPRFVHSTPLDVPLVTVLIADSGLVVETSRLHRRRPMRTSDRNYLHLEAFEVARGEPLALQLRPLEARAQLPKLAAGGLALATTAVLIGFLIAPLRRSGAEQTAVPTELSGAAAERESVLDSIRGLDEDFEMGKLAESDYREMRLELRAEAVDLLRMEREAVSERVTEQTSSPAETPSQRSCPSCAADVAPGSRFCSQCGVALSAPDTTAGDETG